ncbi:NAD(+) synthase [Oecophyllibacter saccharovorans]|uniref:NAD(+) synthase n=1 Tax=Oecophyllibacter saccharovorans TaxID=2558360 RepID=UPI0038B30287
MEAGAREARSLDDFRNLYRQGFMRVAACTLPVTLADPQANARAIAEQLRQCDREAVGLAVFPELGLSGYTLEDLHFQELLLDNVEEALQWLAEATRDLMTVAVIGLPLRKGDQLYNCAAVLQRGRILGIVPKTVLPRYREFYEPRYFTSGAQSGGEGAAGFLTLKKGQPASQPLPFGTDLLFQAEDVPDFTFGVEICEDLWAPASPGSDLAMAGATVLANLSASPVTVGRSEERDLLCRAQSMRALCAYVYAASGAGESTTDLSWDGQTTIHEAGRLLAAGKRFPQEAEKVVADIDLTLLRQERLRNGHFSPRRPFRTVSFTLQPPAGDLGLKRLVPRFPFLPPAAGGLEAPALASAEGSAALARECEEILDIQVQGLCRRLQASGARCMVLGVSGGLDSALALLVAVKAAQRLGWPASRILARSMPGFATGTESRSLAEKLMESLGVSGGTLDIRPTARSMLQAIDHPSAAWLGEGEEAGRTAEYHAPAVQKAPDGVWDVTFENVQAGLRTDFLFRLANQHGGLVIGTGDLSELALGWCTYGVGDQMAHYNVNAGLPKTMVQQLVRWCAQAGGDQDGIWPADCREILDRIVQAEITPELVPDTGQGQQSTQAHIGPYLLQDFTLYQVLRHGFSPWRIAFMQEKAWGAGSQSPYPPGYPEADRASYTLEEIIRWMRVFMRRYFATSQFKRSAMPNGPKILAGGALSPRGDWRAPSDGNAEMWLRDLEQVSALLGQGK